MKKNSIIYFILIFFLFSCCKQNNTDDVHILEPIYYTVTFNSDGGTFIQAQSIREGKTVIEPKSPEKSGFTFKGWYYNENFFDFSTIINSDIILKAKWEKDNKTDSSDPIDTETDNTEETPVENAFFSVNINQFTRYTLQDNDKTEYLVCNADGGLRYKLASNRSHGSWSTYNHLPFSLHSYDYYATSHNGEQIIQVLADKTHLYLLTCVYFDDNDEGTVAPKYVKLWSAEISDWNSDPSWKCINTSTSETKEQIFKVYKNSSSGYYYSAFCIFSTNSINPANRKVYVRSGKYGAYYATKSKISTSEIQTPVYYEINSTGLTALVTMPTTWNRESVSTDYTSINVCSAAYFNDQINFFTSPTVVTNEKYTDMTYTDLASNSTYTKPDYVYWGSGSTLYYLNGKASWGSSATSSISASHNISALAICADSILIGMGNNSAYSSSTSGGITHSPLNSEGKPTGTTDFSTNAASQIPSDYIVFSLLNANPAETETSSALYASIGFFGTGSFSSVGLWSYYPSRGNWNRE